MSFYNIPSYDDFKTRFYRDFPFGSDPTVSVTDQDIGIAYNTVAETLNIDLFNSQGAYTNGWLLLAAHFLVINIQSSSQGISGSFAWNTTSKSVGSVSSSSQIPERIMANPEFAWLTKTNYGTQYLMFILPFLTGQIFSVHGRTHA